ncbi:MAG: hypothetical protein ABI432_11325 [Flavobacteriales bacterium]
MVAFASIHFAMIRSFFFSIACSLPGLLNAQPAAIDWSMELPCATPAEGCTRPRVVINADGAPVVLWGRETGMKADFVAVGDGGGFSAPQQVTYMSTPPAVDYWMGGDIAAVGNEVWISFKATPEETMPAYARRSLDGGYTWGDTIRISNDAWTRFASIAIGNAGEPVVQYMQFDAGFANARYVTTRMSGGAFQPSLAASTPFAPGNVCDCCPGQVVAADDVVVALYRNAGPNIRVIYGAASADGGDTYVAGGLLDATNWNLGGCPATGPDGYVAGDSVRYVWMSGALNGSKVNLCSAALDDFALSPMVKVHPGQSASTEQNYPRIAGSGDTLGIVWEQTVSLERNILFSWSTTGIDGLSAPDTVNTSLGGAERTPDIAFADGAFHVVWSDEATGLVNYRKATLMETTGIEGPAATPQFRAWPMPATITLNVDLPDGVRATLRLFDAVGHCVWTSQGSGRQLELGSIAPGTYVLLASDEHGASLGRVLVQLVH